nr:hypothetical protein [uncultured Clostridium sp.]
MTVKPILFNTDMVRAILDGRKNVTRRILAEKEVLDKNWWLDREPYLHNGKWYYDEQTAVDDSRTCELKPKYKSGDILYVRETWSKNEYGTGFPWLYKASPEYNDFEPDRWHPSIHMPKEAARTWLNVTNVRVERLQDITGDQAVMEGTKEKFPPLAQDEFMGIWDSTIKKTDIDRYGWESNPWVWVIEFERCEKPQELKYADNDTGRYGLMSAT